MKKLIIIISVTTLCLFQLGCQNMERPVLGDFQTDEPIVGDLKFFVPFENDFVEDMKQSIGKGSGVTFIDGISGKAADFDGNSMSSIVSMRTTNDFKNSTSFTVSYWLKMNPPSKSGAQFIWSNPTTSGDWPGANIFQLIEDRGQSNGGLLAAKFVLNGNWLEFVGDNRIPKVMDNTWHHWALIYNENTSEMSVYVDGEKLSLTKKLEKEDPKNSSLKIPYGKVDLSKSTKFILGGPPHSALGSSPDSWMTTYKGGIDQFRMYNKALSQAEIESIFSKKE